MKTEKNFKARTIAMNPALNTPKSKGKVFEMSLEKYFELTESKELAQLVAGIRKAASPEERRSLKAALPYRCPHYFRFLDNRRSQDSIIPEAFSWQTCVDIDDESMVKKAIMRAYLLNSKEGQWQGQLLQMEYSPSGKLHIDIRIPVGMTIREAQEAYCKELGVAFDEACCSPERMIYITDHAQRLYLSDDWYAELPEDEVKVRRQAYLDRGLDIDGREPHQGPTPTAPLMVAVGQPAAQDYPTEYTGIPYDYIVDELTSQLGGIPEHGSRNNFIYTMACHLRYICNDDAQWIQHVMPNFGEDQQRANATIQSACRRQQTKTMPWKVKSALQLARTRVSIEKGMDPNSLMRQPKMPERLPAPVRLLVSKAPKGYQPCIATSIFPAFATYTGGVKAEYWNNTQMELTLITGLVAPMSSGKSCVKEPVDHILAPIQKRDDVAREKEKAWAEDTVTKGANKEKPKRPTDICVQIVDSDMTNAALSQRSEEAEKAGNKALFTRVDEFEQLKKIAGGTSAEVTQIIRRDFDTDVYGQERVGAQSVKTRTHLRLNLLFSTTPDTGKKFMTGNLNNGTASRVNLCTIVPDDVERRPKFGHYDEAFDKKLSIFLARLEEAKGTINCPQAKRLAERLLDRAEERALMMGNKAYEQLSYRAVTIAFRKSIHLYIMCGMKWTKDIEDFIVWSFDYDMWCKMVLLGEELKEKMERENNIMKPGVPCMLEQLGDTFSREEYDALERRECPNAKQRGNLLSQWKRREWVEYNEELKFYVKTEKYYARHTA
ncbi:MAG: hypothetical protein K5764_10550 [Prevotella sp.]|nr:hypothetical protein [Prevotella sp.]